MEARFKYLLVEFS